MYSRSRAGRGIARSFSSHAICSSTWAGANPRRLSPGPARAPSPPCKKRQRKAARVSEAGLRPQFVFILFLLCEQSEDCAFYAFQTPRNKPAADSAQQSRNKRMHETTDEHSAAKPQANSSPSRFPRVLRAFAVKVQPRIHREAAKSAKISRRKILSCQQRIFGLVVQRPQSPPCLCDSVANL